MKSTGGPTGHDLERLPPTRPGDPMRDAHRPGYGWSEPEYRRYPPRDKQPCAHCSGTGWVPIPAEPEWPVK